MSESLLGIPSIPDGLQASPGLVTVQVFIYIRYNLLYSLDLKQISISVYEKNSN